jgi:hypothetical protein
MPTLREACPFLSYVPGVDERLDAVLDAGFDHLREHPDWNKFASTVVDAAIGCLGLSIGQMMPLLVSRAEIALPTWNLSTRSQNLLARSDVMTWGDLLSWSPEQIWDLRNAGLGTVREILRLCVDHAGVAVTTDDVQLAPLQTSTSSITAAAPDPSLAPAVRQFLDAVSTMAAWMVRERSGLGATSLWRLNPELDVPESVANDWAKALDIDLDVLANANLRDADISKLTNSLMEHFDQASQMVLTRRVFATEPWTLDQIGKELDLTRERVRPIQSKAESRLRGLLAEIEFVPLQWRSLELAAALGRFAPSRSAGVRKALARATRDIDTDFRPIVEAALLFAAGPYRMHNGWYCSADTKLPTARDIHVLVDGNGVIDVDAALEWLDEHGLHRDHLDEWIATVGGLRRQGEKLLPWSGSVVDKCVALLSLRGTPADADALVAEIGEGHNARGVRARLFEDARLMRVNRRQWALREWGLEEYTGIADEIAQRIREWGGKASVQTLVDELVRQFGVSANSVRVYVDAPMFVRENGSVRMRRDDEPYMIDEELVSCRGAFRVGPSVISYLLPVDKDVLRGSGRGCPAGLAAALGVGPGTPRSFRAADGPLLLVSWPETSALGPALGSTRGFADAVGAEVGDYLRLQFDSTLETVRAARVTANFSEVLTPEEAVEVLTGSHAGGDVRTVLANAIGVSPANVDAALRRRGDDRIADILPPPVIDSGLSDALHELSRALDAS